MEKYVEKRRINVRHIDVLDGIRALAVLMVLWFHFWQQSWLMPVIQLPDFLARIGLPGNIGLDYLPRAGYLFVDLLLLLSAFCLYLPHARATLLGEPVPDAGTFYKKRVARIVPSYYLSVLIIFFAVALPSGAYRSLGDALCELLPMLTFTQTFFPKVFLNTRLNGVLWTAAVEMQFYLLFPLLAFCFRKKPLFTYLGMASISMVYLHILALGNPDTLRISLNQLPGFFGVFANGMLAAYAFVWLSKKTERKPWLAAAATVVSLACFYGIARAEMAAPGTNPVQIWQAANRYWLSLLFAALILSTALSAGWYRFLFSNRVVCFLGAISYNVYIWHQWIAVKLKEWRIPYWEGEKPPNFTGDAPWQWKYTLLALGASLLIATAVTYLFEKPMSHWILGKEKDRRTHGKTV